MSGGLRKKIVVVSALVHFAIAAFTGISVYLASSRIFLNLYLSQQKSTAGLIADTIDGERHRGFTNLPSVHDPEYQKYLSLFMDRLKKDKSITYLYTLNYQAENDEFCYGVDGIILNSDTVWIESDAFALEVRMDDSNHIQSLKYDQKEYTTPVTLNYNGREIELGIDPNALTLSGIPILTTSARKNTVQTPGGLISIDQRSQEYTFTDQANLSNLTLYYSYTEKGASESDPGAVYVDTSDNLKRLKTILTNNQDYVEPELKKDIYGECYSAFGIIHDESGKTVGLVVLDVYRQSLLQSLQTVMLVAIIFALIVFGISFLYSLFLSDYILRPIHEMTHFVRLLKNGNRDVVIDINRKDEFGELGSIFNTMAASVNHSLSMLEATLNATSDGILTVDSQGTITHFNTNFLSIWNIPPNFPPSGFVDWIQEQIEEPDGFVELLRKGKIDPYSPNIFIQHTHDEKIIECCARVQQVNGAPTGMVWSFNDVTQKKKDEAEIQLIAKVFESSIEGIIITDPATHILRVNDAFTKITGFQAYEAIGQKAALFCSGWNDDMIYETLWTSIIDYGIWQGEITDRRKNGSPCSILETIIALKSKDGHVTNYIIIYQDITEKKQIEEQIKVLAYYDVLTHLPNRTLFYDRLEQTIAQSQRYHNKFAVFFIDLDNFKKINDEYGHRLGDLVLKTAAERFMSCLRKYDTCSRIGGDEFTILLPDVENKQVVVAIAERIISMIGKPIPCEAGTLQIGASVGVAIFPDDGEAPGELIEKADTAMYAAKRAGKNHFVFFDPQTHQKEYLELRGEKIGHLT